MSELFLYRLSRLQAQAVAPVGRLCQARYGLSRREWRLIVVLARHGPVLSSELAELAQLDRARRVVAFGPILPLFAPRPDGVEAVHFPPQVLARLWTLAAGREPELLPLLDDEDRAAVVADRIGLAAASAVGQYRAVSTTVSRAMPVVTG